MIVGFVLIFLVGFCFGVYISGKMTLKAIEIQTKKYVDEKNSSFREVFSKIKEGRSRFKSRVNDAVYISTYLESHGDVDVLLLIDKNDLSIFKESVCIYTSDGVDKSVLLDTISLIFKVYDKNINDVVEILGFTLYREEFEKSFNIKIEDFKKSNIFSHPEVSEIDKIKEDNEERLDIDDILDKISSFGISVLSIEERLFLDNYGNGKRN